jgi:hypothetical protein
VRSRFDLGSLDDMGFKLEGFAVWTFGSQHHFKFATRGGLVLTTMLHGQAAVAQQQAMRQAQEELLQAEYEAEMEEEYYRQQQQYAQQQAQRERSEDRAAYQIQFEQEQAQVRLHPVVIYRR